MCARAITLSSPEREHANRRLYHHSRRFCFYSPFPYSAYFVTVTVHLPFSMLPIEIV